MQRSHVILGCALFAVIWAALLPGRLAEPLSLTFSSDASEYNGAAIHLAESLSYSLDGVKPFLKREPGQSLFLAAVYTLFGIENRFAVYLAQGILYLVAVTAFVRALSGFAPRRVVALCFFLLLTFPPVFHILFSFAREALALTLFLFFAAAFLALKRTGSRVSMAAAGMSLGFLMLTYIPFLPFPFVLPLFVPLWRMKLVHVLGVMALAFLVVVPWGVRNYGLTGNPCLTGCYRTSVQWYARGEQAENIRGLEPFRCLWSEYISRDWTGRSPYCSLNAIMHRRWPEGLTGSADDIAAGVEGRQKILRYAPFYLWFSVFEVLELHLPYVDGWGRWYNVLAALGSLVLYAGCLLSIPAICRKPDYWLLLVIIGYTTAVFALTDATPRYLMPVIFAYAALAAVGYDWLLQRFHRSWLA